MLLNLSLISLRVSLSWQVRGKTNPLDTKSLTFKNAVYWRMTAGNDR